MAPCCKVVVKLNVLDDSPQYLIFFKKIIYIAYPDTQSHDTHKASMSDMDTSADQGRQLGLDLLTATANGDLARVKDLRQRGAWVLTDEHNRTAYMLAAGGGHLEVLRWLRFHDDDRYDITDKDLNGRTIHHYAASSGNVRLINLVASMHTNEELDIDQMTPLDVALQCGDLNAAQAISAHAVRRRKRTLGTQARLWRAHVQHMRDAHVNGNNAADSDDGSQTDSTDTY